MGRVFDAIKRASATEETGGANVQPTNAQHRSANRDLSSLPSARQVEEQLFASSSILAKPIDSVPSSASTAHTANVPDGSALPGGLASRDAGATLGAAGATRAEGLVTYDITAARVEPHLVAVSQPRSAYTCLLYTSPSPRDS